MQICLAQGLEHPKSSVTISNDAVVISIVANKQRVFRCFHYSFLSLIVDFLLLTPHAQKTYLFIFSQTCSVSDTFHCPSTASLQDLVQATCGL